ncbi:OmpA family protein [Chondromyces apiculatus]|uniref:OmpA/MotB domain protein n=1 Tax=Chondromyces apiculatus DSM 436 TaxID=1192034 RepID=A0A017TGY5_9BACT|nr:OmpA family protein [Chondromyces apiculatus]EYF07886.1 OmpA/MotB domain protein [Chondromyces apiculatus DSM 436]
MMVAAGTGCTAKASFNAGAKEPEAQPAPATPAPTPPPAEEKKPRRRMRMAFKMKGFQLDLPGPINFETGTAKIKPESEEVLNIVHEFLVSRKDVSVLRVEGHTDDVGDDAKNQTLSEQRALAVAQWLVAKGDDCKRLLPVGFGETKPVGDNKTEEGKALNRRTEFHIAAIDGKAVENKPVDGGGKSAGDPCK